MTDLLCVDDVYDTYVVIKCPLRVTSTTTTAATLSHSSVVNNVLAHSGAIDNDTDAEHTTNTTNTTTNNTTTTVPTVPMRSLRAHRSVLSLRSPVLKAMLEAPMTEGESGEILIDDNEYEVMREVLLFIYSNTFSSNDIYILY